MFDVIVVGARCAGSPTAMLLARAGYNVLLTDRATFPSDTLSTHALKVAGTASLKRWGLLDTVFATNCPPMTHWTFDVGPFALTGAPVPLDGLSTACCVRRARLDPILAEAAIAAGAELREHFAVTDLIWDDGRVVGVRAQTESGSIVEERCKLVIGADGQRSFVARTVRAPVYNERGSLTCAYYTYWSGVPVTGVELYLRERRLIAAFATNDSLSVIFASAPRDEFPALRSDVGGGYLRTLDLAPKLAEPVRAGRREEPFAGTADLPNFFRRPWGPGWALIGDASYHKDPITGQGITDAFRDAELLADAVDEGLSGRRPLDAALADYELRRNQLAFPIFDLACQIAALTPPTPEEAALYGALRGNQEETSRFFGMIENTVAVQDFFSPESVGRIVAGAGSAV